MIALRALVAVLVLSLVSGCNPVIRCWYAEGHPQHLGEPWVRLVGRTDRLSRDVDGPFLANAAAARQYIVENRLQMCGTQAEGAALAKQAEGGPARSAP